MLVAVYVHFAELVQYLVVRFFTLVFAFVFVFFLICIRPANFEKQKFIFWHPKISILYKKIVFLRTQISERNLNIYSLLHVFFMR